MAFLDSQKSDADMVKWFKGLEKEAKAQAKEELAEENKKKKAKTAKTAKKKK